MPYIQQVAVGRLPELNVYGHDYPTKDGSAIRDYIHVMDVADGHIAALQKLFTTENIGDHFFVHIFTSHLIVTCLFSFPCHASLSVFTCAAMFLNKCILERGYRIWVFVFCKSMFISRCTAYNLGTGCGTSVLEIVAAFEKASGKKIPIKLCPRRPGDATAVYASTEKAEKELGWKAKFGVEEICRDQWTWASKNPWGYQSKP